LIAALAGSKPSSPTEAGVVLGAEVAEQESDERTDRGRRAARRWTAHPDVLFVRLEDVIFEDIISKGSFCKIKTVVGFPLATYT
jgi:hypothetical protein